MRSTVFLRSACGMLLLGIAATRGARAADAPAPVVRLVPEEHATIQSAVDAAFPGDTIRVGSGVWGESVAVTFDDPADALTIVATDAVIDGGESPALSVSGPGTFRLVDGTLRSSRTALAVTGTKRDALRFSLEGSTVLSGVIAIFVVRANADLNLADASAVAGHAIVARDCPTLSVSGNVSGAGRSGLVAERVDAANLDGLRVRSCGEDGVRFSGSDLLMRFCEVRDAGRTGFDLTFSKQCVVEHNTVIGAAFRGISLAWRPRATVIVGNNVVAGGEQGIVARGGDGTIRDNRVSGAIKDGIVWRGTLLHRRVDGRPNGLVSNEISASGRSAIRIEGGGHRLLANEITRGDAGGVPVSGHGRIAASRGNTVDGRALR